MGSEIFKLKSLYMDDTVARGARISIKNARTTKTIVVNSFEDPQIKTGETGINTEYLLQAALKDNDLKGYATFTDKSPVISGYSGPQDLKHGDVIRLDYEASFYTVTGIQGTDIYITDKYAKPDNSTPSVQSGPCTVRKIKLGSALFEYVTNETGQNNFYYNKDNVAWGITGSVEFSGPFITPGSPTGIYPFATGMNLEFQTGTTNTAPDLMSVNTVHKTLVDNNPSPISDVALSPLPYPHESLKVFFGSVSSSLVQRTEYEDYLVNYSQNPDVRYPKPPYEERDVAYIKFLDRLTEEPQVDRVDTTFEGAISVIKKTVQAGGVNLPKAVKNIIPTSEFIIKVGVDDKATNKDYVVDYGAGIVTFIKHRNSEGLIDTIIYPKSIIWDGISTLKGVGKDAVQDINNLVIPPISGIAGVTGMVYYEDVEQNALIRDVDYIIDPESGAIRLTTPLKDSESVLMSYYVEGEDVSGEYVLLTDMRVNKYPVIYSSLTLVQNYTVVEGDTDVSRTKVLIEGTDFEISYFTGKIRLLSLSSEETIVSLQASYTPLAQINCILQSVPGNDLTYRMTVIDDILKVKNGSDLVFTIDNPAVSVPKKKTFGSEGTDSNYDFLGTIIDGSLLSLKEKDSTVGFNVTDYTYTDSTRELKLDGTLNKDRVDSDALIVATYSFESDLLPYAPVQVFFPVYAAGQDEFLIEGFDRTDVLKKDMILRIDNFDPEMTYYFRLKEVTYYDGENTRVKIYGTFPDQIVRPTFYLFDDEVNWQSLPTGVVIDKSTQVNSESIILQGNMLDLRRKLKINCLLKIDDEQIYTVKGVSIAGNVATVTIFPYLRSAIDVGIQYSNIPVYTVDDTDIAPEYPILTSPEQPAFTLGYNPPDGFDGGAKILIDADNVVLYESVAGVKNPTPYTFRMKDYGSLYDLAKVIQATPSTFPVNVPDMHVPDYSPFTIAAPDGSENYYLDAGVWSADLIIPFEEDTPLDIPYTVNIIPELFHWTLLHAFVGNQFFLVEKRDRRDIFAGGDLLAFRDKIDGEHYYFEVDSVDLTDNATDKTLQDSKVNLKDAFRLNLLDSRLFKYSAPAWDVVENVIAEVDTEHSIIVLSGSLRSNIKVGSFLKIADKYIYKVKEIAYANNKTSVTVGPALDSNIKAETYHGYLKSTRYPIYLDEPGRQPYLSIEYTAPIGHVGTAEVQVLQDKVTIREVIDNFYHKSTTLKFSDYDDYSKLIAAINSTTSYVPGKKPYAAEMVGELGVQALTDGYDQYRLEITTGYLPLSRYLTIGVSAFSVEYTVPVGYTGRGQIRVEADEILIREVIENYQGTEDGIKVTHVVYADTRDLQDIIENVIPAISSMVPGDIHPFGTTVLHDDFFGEGYWSSTFISPTYESYEDMPSKVYGRIVEAQWQELERLDETRFVPDTDYSIENGSITLTTGVQARDRYRLNYMGLWDLGEYEGEPVLCTCQFITDLPAASRLDVQFDYLNVDQFYLQKCTERKFTDIVVVPQIGDLLDQTSSGGQGSDSGANNNSIPNYSGGVVDLYYLLRDEEIKKQLYVRFFEWYKNRLRNFSAELQLGLGFKFAHSNALGLDENGQYTLVDAYVETPDYTLTSDADLEQITNGYSKFFPVKYQESDPVFYPRFSEEYLSYNEVYCCNIKYTENGTRVNKGIVKSERPYWKRESDLVFKVWADDYLNPNLVGYYNVDVSSDDRSFEPGTYTFLQTVREGDSIKIEGKKNYYKIKFIESSVTEVSEPFIVADGKMVVERTDWKIGDVVRVSTTGVLPTPLTADTNYYVVGSDSSGLSIATTSSGSPFSLTSYGYGTHTVSRVSVDVDKTYEYMILSTPISEKGIRTYDLDKINAKRRDKNKRRHADEQLAMLSFDDMMNRLPPDGRRIYIQRQSSETFPMFDDYGSLGATAYGDAIDGHITDTRRIKKPSLKDFLQLILPIVPESPKLFKILVKRDSEGEYEPLKNEDEDGKDTIIDLSKLTFKEERNVDDVMDALRNDFAVKGLLPAMPPITLLPKIIYDTDENDKLGFHRYFYLSFERIYAPDEKDPDGYYQGIVIRAKNREWWFKVVDGTEEDSPVEPVPVIGDYGFDDSIEYKNFYDPDNIYKRLLLEKQAWETEELIVEDLYDLSDKLARAFDQGDLNNLNSLFQGYLAKAVGGTTDGISDILRVRIPAYEKQLLFLINTVGPVYGTLYPDMVHAEDSASPEIALTYQQAMEAWNIYNVSYNKMLFYRQLNEDNNLTWRNDYVNWVLSLESGLVYQKDAKEMYEQASRKLTVGIREIPAIAITLPVGTPFRVEDATATVYSDYIGKYLRIDFTLVGVSNPDLRTDGLNVVFYLYTTMTVDDIPSIVYKTLDQISNEISAYRYSGQQLFSCTNVFEHYENNVLCKLTSVSSMPIYVDAGATLTVTTVADHRQSDSRVLFLNRGIEDRVYTHGIRELPGFSLSYLGSYYEQSVDGAAIMVALTPSRSQYLSLWTVSYGTFLNDSSKKVFVVKITKDKDYIHTFDLYDEDTQSYITLSLLVRRINLHDFSPIGEVYAEVVYDQSPYDQMSTSYMQISSDFIPSSMTDTAFVCMPYIHADTDLDSIPENLNQAIYRIYYDTDFRKKLEIKFDEVIKDGSILRGDSNQVSAIFTFEFQKADGIYKTLNEFTHDINTYVYKQEHLFSAEAVYEKTPGENLTTRFVVTENRPKFLGFDQSDIINVDTYVESISPDSVSDRNVSTKQNAYFSFPYYTANGNPNKVPIEGIPVAGDWDTNVNEDVIELECIDGTEWTISFQDYSEGDYKNYKPTQEVLAKIDSAENITQSEYESLGVVLEQPVVSIIKELVLTRDNADPLKINLRQHCTINELVEAINAARFNADGHVDDTGIRQFFFARGLGDTEIQGTYKSYEINATYVPIIKSFTVLMDNGSIAVKNNKFIGWEIKSITLSAADKHALQIASRRYSPTDTYGFTMKTPEVAYDDTLNNNPQGFRRDTLAFDVYCWDDAGKYEIKDNWIYFQSASLVYDINADMGQPDKTLGVGIPIAGSGHIQAPDHESLADLMNRINSNGAVSKWFYVNLKFTRKSWIKPTDDIDNPGFFEYDYLPNYSATVPKSQLDSFYLRDDVVMYLKPGDGYTFTASSCVVNDTADTLDLSCTWTKSYDYEVTYDLSALGYTTIAGLASKINLALAPTFPSSVFEARVVGNRAGDPSTGMPYGQGSVTEVSETFTVGAGKMVVARTDWKVRDVIRVMTTGTLPAPLVAGTDYYVVDNSFSGLGISATPTGSPLALAGGSGTNTVTRRFVDFGVSIAQTFTVNIGTDQLVVSDTDWNVNDAVRLSTTGTLPAATPTLIAGADYYIVDKTIAGPVVNFKISQTVGGTPVNITGPGTGIHTVHSRNTTALQIRVRNLSGANFAITAPTFSVSPNASRMILSCKIQYTNAFSLIGIDISTVTLGNLTDYIANLHDYTDEGFGPLFDATITHSSFNDREASRLLDHSSTIVVGTALMARLNDIVAMKMLNMTPQGTVDISLFTFTARTYKTYSRFIQMNRDLHSWIDDVIRGDYKQGLVYIELVPFTVAGVPYGLLGDAASQALATGNTPAHGYFGVMGDINWMQVSDYNLHIQLNYIKERLGQPWKNNQGIVQPDYYTPEQYNENNPYAIDIDNFLGYLRTGRYNQIKNSMVNEAVVQNKYLWLYLKFHKEFGCDQRVIALQKQIKKQKKNSSLLLSMG